MTILILKGVAISKTFPIPSFRWCCYKRATFHCSCWCESNKKIKRTARVSRVTMEVFLFISLGKLFFLLEQGMCWGRQKVRKLRSKLRRLYSLIRRVLFSRDVLEIKSGRWQRSLRAWHQIYILRMWFQSFKMRQNALQRLNFNWNTRSYWELIFNELSTLNFLEKTIK